MPFQLGGILGFDNGIVLAPVGTEVAGPKLVAAVANAGGIGLLASPVNNYEMTKKAITEIKKLTSKPFGAGIVLEFDNTQTVHAIFHEKLACMQVVGGDYPKELVDEAHKHGVKILHQVGSVKDAEKAVAAGVDCIIAQGVEAGGHVIGQISVIALVPRVVDIVGDRGIAVVAGGAIADPRGYVTALALGAKGVCLEQGTRLAKDVLSTDQIIKNFVEGAKKIIKKLNKKYIGGAEETSEASAEWCVVAPTSS